VWLWTILLRGEPLHPYNVGSESAMSIADVAHAVASRFERCEVRIEGTPRPGAAADRYVPSTARARRELGLSPTVDFDDALTRTVEWYRARGTSTHAAN
jgi:dTDP-glucose 4,6-dehydratase